jgi:hypothetical protein
LLSVVLSGMCLSQYFSKKPLNCGQSNLAQGIFAATNAEHKSNAKVYFSAVFLGSEINICLLFDFSLSWCKLVFSCTK